MLPLLDHEGCLSLLSCIDGSITLEIYLDEAGYASGEIYLDDGETFDYLSEGKRARYTIEYHDGKLTSTLVDGTGDSFNRQISNVNVYGAQGQEKENLRVKDASMQIGSDY